MHVDLSTHDLGEVLKSKFGEDTSFTIAYHEPGTVWKERHDITDEDIRFHRDGGTLYEKYPRISEIIRL